jgi:photosystem II oxygen-evolving enhancer protein 3
LKTLLRIVVAPTTARVANKARSAVVARAEDSRRAVLGGMLVGGLALATPAANAVDIIDDRAAKAKGFDIIYEARDLDLPQGQRDGLFQARGDVELTKKRIAESVARINGKLGSDIEKKYWTEAREELRRQVGTLSFDINTLASSLGKADRKEAEALKKTLKAEVTALDFAIRKKNKDVAVKEYADVKAALGAVLSKIGA